MQEPGATLEGLMDTLNVVLEQQDWAQVVQWTVPLYEASLAAGETELAEVVQDLHWIAQDALVHPLQVAEVVQP